MKVAIFSLNYAPEMTGVGYYSGGLAEDLHKSGHDVTVFSSYPFYPQWKLWPGRKVWRWSTEKLNGVNVQRCPTYVPPRPTGFTRLIHYISFAFSCLIPSMLHSFRDKPDLVISVAPSIFSALPALVLARISGAKSILHVQDFEVEAGFATGQMKGQGWLSRLALSFERWIIGACDMTTSISPTMCRKLVEKGAKGVVYEFRNWAEVRSIRPQSSSTYRERWNVNAPNVALYSGSIARKQGIEIIVQTANLLKHRKDLIFVICGVGPSRADLEASAKDLSNIQFHDLQPMEELNELLNLATIHLLPQKADAADLVLPSKLANMLASGRPIIAGVTQDRSLADEVKGAGLIYEPENPAAMAEAIEKLIDNATLYKSLAVTARQLAEDVWDRQSIIRDFENAAQALVSEESGTAPKVTEKGNIT
ncbi:WcaI family glycosyltransferase [Altericroceibacterium endophyticum]